MTRLLLVRHARPAASWEASSDPPLDAVGREQAQAVAARLADRGPLPVVTSPLRRARETAAPLAARWGNAARVVDAVGEIPSPMADLAERGVWLRRVLTQRWDEVDDVLRAWRDHLLDVLRGFEHDTVVFTHYVAINVAVGAATGDDRLTSCMPQHASVTELDVDPAGQLALVSFDGPSDEPQVDSPL